MRLFTDALCWIAARLVFWWWERENRNTPHRCAGGAEPEAPAGRCEHGVDPARCLICDDESTPLEEATRRDAEMQVDYELDALRRILKDAQDLSDKKTLEDNPLPSVFEDWIARYLK